jgi:hypothetical protein
VVFFFTRTNWGLGRFAEKWRGSSMKSDTACVQGATKVHGQGEAFFLSLSLSIPCNGK